MDPLLNALDCYLDRKYQWTGNQWTRATVEEMARHSDEGCRVLDRHGPVVFREFIDRYFYQSVPHFDKVDAERPPRKRALSHVDAVLEDAPEEHDRKRHRVDPATITDDEIGKGWLKCRGCYTDLTSRDACYTRHGKERGRTADDVVCLACWTEDYAESHCGRCGTWRSADMPIARTHYGPNHSTLNLCQECCRLREPPHVVRMKRRKDGTIVQKADVYIGRACTMGGWNLAESVWHNPFKLSIKPKPTPEQVQDVLAKYEAHVRAKPKLMARLPELCNRSLGCFCAPKPCHGDVLIKLVREWQEKEGHVLAMDK